MNDNTEMKLTTRPRPNVPEPLGGGDFASWIRSEDGNIYPYPTKHNLAAITNKINEVIAYLKEKENETV